MIPRFNPRFRYNYQTGIVYPDLENKVNTAAAGKANLLQKISIYAAQALKKALLQRFPGFQLPYSTDAHTVLTVRTWISPNPCVFFAQQ